jgi:hypothetical protein
MASAYGLKELKLPDTLQTVVLNSPTLVEGVFSSLLSSLDSDKNAVLAVSLDAEWNISRRIGVSIIQIAPHSQPNEIYCKGSVSCENETRDLLVMREWIK